MASEAGTEGEETPGPGEFKDAMEEATALANAIGLFHTASLREVIELLEEHRKIRIDLRPMKPRRPRVTGVTFKEGDLYTIEYHGRGGDFVKNRATLHELGHIAFRHPFTTLRREDVAEDLGIDVEDAPGEPIYFKHGSGPLERQAEAFGDLLLNHLMRVQLRIGREPMKFGTIYG